MLSDERVVDQVVKNELLRLKQPPRIDVVEVHRVLCVLANDLTCLIFPQDKLARTPRLVRM